QPGYSPCEFCGEPLPQSATALWDGEWLWPHTLAHAVEQHGVRLPDALVARSRSRGDVTPQFGGVELAGADAVNAALVELLTAPTPQNGPGGGAEPLAAADPAHKAGPGR